jgi:hypothetical protein
VNPITHLLSLLHKPKQSIFNPQDIPSPPKIHLLKPFSLVLHFCVTPQSLPILAGSQTMPVFFGKHVKGALGLHLDVGMGSSIIAIATVPLNIKIKIALNEMNVLKIKS